VLANALIEIDPHYPTVSAAARKDLAKARDVLEAQAPKGAARDPFEERLARQRKKAKTREPGLVVAGVADGKVNGT
jgi:hypothetical protein